MSGVTPRKGAKRSFVVDDQPRSVTLRAATASPFRLVPKEQAGRPDKGFAIGCLYDVHGQRVDLSQRQGALPPSAPICIDPPTIDLDDPTIAAAERRSGRTLYLGNFMNHYGHFITEFLSRLWLPERSDAFDHIVAYTSIANRGRYLPRHHHHYLAGLLGLPLSRLEILRTPVRFEEVVVPQQLWEVNGLVNSHLRPFYAGIHAQHVRPRGTGRLFVSRGLYPGNRLSNSPEVEEVFASFGFSVLHPQELGIERQLDLYANCEILAGLSGSGMHNCLFCRPGTLVIDVGDIRSPRHSMRMQVMANQLAPVSATFVPYVGGEDGRTDIAALTERLSTILGEKPRRGRVAQLYFRRLADWLARPRQVLRRNRKR